MASSLEWRTGFGWGTLLGVVGSLLVAALYPGATRAAALVIAVAIGAYAVHRYRTWNGPGWRRVHFRAMLAYAGIAEREGEDARRSGREFDLRHACSRLGSLLCGDENGAAVDAMLTEIDRTQGALLAGLFERHAFEILPGVPPDLRHDITARVRALKFGPQLLIACVIENTQGSREAARYAVALVTGDAR